LEQFHENCSRSNVGILGERGQPAPLQPASLRASPLLFHLASLLLFKLPRLPCSAPRRTQSQSILGYTFS
ncbi:MAG: hypothetical protein ABSF38_08075, partial [Verrucomicrobiota bacterium]